MPEENLQAKSKKKTTMIIIIVVVVILLILGTLIGGGCYLYSKLIQGKLATAPSGLEYQPQTDQQETSEKSPEKETKESSSTSSGCSIAFTDQEKLEMENWKTQQNSKYNYSFKYPDSWSLNMSEDDIVSIANEDMNLNLQFRSDTMTTLGLEGFKKDSSKETKVDCQTATMSYFSSDPNAETPANEDNKMIIVQFKKDNISHLILFSYKDLGASYSGDLIDAFNLILKTIDFK